MKKKISILGTVLILAFSLLTGCSSSDNTEYDQSTLEQYANFIVENFSMMSDDDFDNFADMSDLELDLTLLSSGLPADGEDFLTMIDAWKAGLEECGDFISTGEYNMEVTNDGPILSVPAEFTNRSSTLEFQFDEEMNLTSLTVSADYSTGEILQKAGLNTILGMGTVFVVLIFLSFVIWLLKFIPVLEKKFKKTPETKAEVESAQAAPVNVPEPEETQDVSDDSELVAVIAAAVAASQGTSTDGFIVRSIRRRKSNKWI